MFDEVDEAVRRLLRERVIDEREVAIAFDAPTKDWAARRNAPTVNVYLYDIQEDLGRREAGLFDVYGDDGTLIGRRPLARHFVVSYLVTAWTPRPEDEHRLLGALLDGFLASDALEADQLTGSLAVWPRPIPIVVSHPASNRGGADIWTALGGQLRPALDIAVVAPMPYGRMVPVGPPSTEPPRFRFNGQDSGVRPLPVGSPA